MDPIAMEYFEWCKERLISRDESFIKNMPYIFRKHLYLYRLEGDDYRIGISEEPIDEIASFDEIEDNGVSFNFVISNGL